MTSRQRAIVRPFVIAVAIGAALCQAGSGAGSTRWAPAPSSGSGGAAILGAALGPVAATPAHVPAPPGK
ncbi:MAG: hypothetical protein ACJ780_24840, partial [Solirubrobacteraceae bacterium]